MNYPGYLELFMCKLKIKGHVTGSSGHVPIFLKSVTCPLNFRYMSLISTHIVLNSGKKNHIYE